MSCSRWIVLTGATIQVLARFHRAQVFTESHHLTKLVSSINAITITWQPNSRCHLHISTARMSF